MSFETGNKLGVTHGLSKTRTYRKWSTMISRCRIDPRYRDKGITVCARWHAFENFLKDMGECPSGKEIDRKNNALGYSKSNCRWVTRDEQQRNKTSSVILTYGGKTQCAKDWSVELGIHYATLLHRLHVGWSIEQAFTVSPKFGNRKVAT